MAGMQELDVCSLGESKQQHHLHLWLSLSFAQPKQSYRASSTKSTVQVPQFESRGRSILSNMIIRIPLDAQGQGKNILHTCENTKKEIVTMNLVVCI